MQSFKIFSIISLARAVLAQTPSGWNLTSAVTTPLNLTFANNNINPVGEPVSRAGTCYSLVNGFNRPYSAFDLVKRNN